MLLSHEPLESQATQSCSFCEPHMEPFGRSPSQLAPLLERRLTSQLSLPQRAYLEWLYQRCLGYPDHPETAGLCEHYS